MSAQWRPVLLIALAVLVGGCRQPFAVEAPATVTPLRTAPTATAVSAEAIGVSIVDLSANPALFNGARVRLTGAFRRLPLLVCTNGTPYQSPASWGVVEDGVIVLAGGQDSQMRSLLPDGLLVSVEGRWLQWEGPIGCGKEAVPQSFWYLASERVLSPSPLALVTLTPAAEAVVVVLPEGEESPLATPALPSQPATSTIAIPEPTVAAPAPPTTPAQATVPAAPLATSTPTVVVATITPLATATISGTLAATATIQPGATPSPGATAAGTPATTATVQPTAEASVPVSKGSLVDEDLYVDALGAGERHLWSIETEAGDEIDVTVATVDNVDLILAVRDAQGNVAAQANSGAAGAAERITDLFVASGGDYTVEVKSANGAAAEYGLLFRYSYSNLIELQGALEYGDSVSLSLDADAEHYWLFKGEAGDTITITLLPDSSADGWFELYQPGISQPTLADDLEAGGMEQLASFPLTTSGLHYIYLGEWDFNPMQYQLQIGVQ